jgi:hypothetical protein
MNRLNLAIALGELFVYVAIGIPVLAAATLLWWGFLPVVLLLRMIIMRLWPEGKDTP